jgi:hypothetical protein
MQNIEPERERERRQDEERQKHVAYQSILYRLRNIKSTEEFRSKAARKRTGITQPATLYDGTQKSGLRKDADPGFIAAMRRLWDIGKASDPIKADTELRRVYHLIAKGQAPLTEADVIKLGAIPESQLRLLLGWLAHRLSLDEARDRVKLGEIAPSIIATEEIQELRGQGNFNCRRPSGPVFVPGKTRNSHV